ncbi:hypothetical protein GCM10027090_38730 [Sinomonas soli]
MLVQKYRDKRGDGEDKELRAEITRAIDASPSRRNKRDLIEDFVDRVSAEGDVDDEYEWRRYIAERLEWELSRIIEDESLRPEETRSFVDASCREGSLRTSGTAITKVLPPVSRFSAQGGHGEKKQRVLAKPGEFFEWFFGLSSRKD